MQQMGMGPGDWAENEMAMQQMAEMQAEMAHQESMRRQAAAMLHHQQQQQLQHHQQQQVQHQQQSAAAAAMMQEHLQQEQMLAMQQAGHGQHLAMDGHVGLEALPEDDYGGGMAHGGNGGYMMPMGNGGPMMHHDNNVMYGNGGQMGDGMMHPPY